MSCNRSSYSGNSDVKPEGVEGVESSLPSPDMTSVSWVEVDGS